jgi:hypothetical protein
MRRISKFTRLAREIILLALLAVKLVTAVWDLVSKAVNWIGNGTELEVALETSQRQDSLRR